MATFLKYIHNDKVKKVCFRPELRQIDALTRSAKEAFKLKKQQLLLYYMDNDGQKIVLLSNEDIGNMTKAVQPVNGYYTVHVARRETALEENIESNIQILVRYYIEKIRPRFATVESLRTAEFKEALRKILAHMNRRKISEYLAQQIVNGISYQMKTELIEGQLDDIMKRIESQNPGQKQHLLRPLNTSVSTIRSVKVSEESKLISIDQNTTFLSPTDVSNFNNTVGGILGGQERCSAIPEDTIDNSGEVIIEERCNRSFCCSKCHTPIRSSYFECIECDMGLLCLQCERRTKHSHMLVKRLGVKAMVDWG